MGQGMVNLLGSEPSARLRKCRLCGHMNAAHALVCVECESVLTGSDWVDVPAQTAPDRPAHDPDNVPTSQLNRRVVDTLSQLQAPASVVQRGTEDSDYIEQRPDYGHHAADLQALYANGTDALETVRVHYGASKRVPLRGTPVFESQMLLCLELNREEPPIVLRLPQQRPLLFGRDDPDSGQRPDIDLVPYGAYHKGVSRHHAALELSGTRLTLRDLSSVNGTFLNGVRLAPHEEHQLRDGDRVRMGNMTVNVFFNHLH